MKYWKVKEANSQVFLILNRAVKQLLYLRVERFQSSFFFGVGEVYTHISTRRYNVELGIKHINSMYNTVESRKSESSVTLVLTNSILAEIISNNVMVLRE